MKHPCSAATASCQGRNGVEGPSPTCHAGNKPGAKFLLQAGKKLCGGEGLGTLNILMGRHGGWARVCQLCSALSGLGITGGQSWWVLDKGLR